MTNELRGKLLSQSAVLTGLDRVDSLEVHHGQLNAILGLGGGDIYGRLEALYRLSQRSSLYGYAEDGTRTGLSAGLGYRLNF